jgi:hypothetical protein
MIDNKEPDTGRDAILDAISIAICAKRDEAITGRKNSGIEQIWTEDEEFYEGYDDANRHEFKPLASKPTEGGRDVTPKKSKGSTLFPNITAPYVDMAAAKISDMLMGSADWRNFEVKPTPIPKVLKLREKQQPPQVPPMAAAQPGMPQLPGQSALGLPQGNPAQQVMAGGLQQAGAPAMPMQAPPQLTQPPAAPPDVLTQLMEKFKAVKAQADQSAQKAEDAIYDAFVENQFQDSMRQVILDAAKLGTGVVKGPVPTKRKTRVAQKDDATGDYTLVVDVETKPDSVRVDARNCYPDYPACGEDIHAGNFFLEFAPCTEKQLRALKGGQGPASYIDEQIDKCVEEGPSKSKVEASGLPVPLTNYPRWYFYGVLKAGDFAAAGYEKPDNKGDEEQIPVIATMVNDRVIKLALNPMEANEFPYDFLVWKERSGMPWGIGVGRQGRTGQRIVTAGVRNLMDNAGASAKPHKVKTDGIEQDGDPWTWVASADTTDVRGAMQFFVQPSLQQELEGIIERGHRQIELETGLPMTVLGMSGDIQETAKGRTILNNNGSTVLRRIARNFDIAIESHVRRYYDWLLLYSEDEEIKSGDLQIQARGSSSLVERDLQSQQLPMILQMSNDPMMRISKTKARDELLKSMHFDPATFEMDDDEWQQAQAMMQNRPPAPQVQAAEINAASKEKIKGMELQAEAADRVQEAHENEADRQIAVLEQQVIEHVQAMKSQGERESTIEQLKAMLAATSIKVQAQRDLSPHGAGPQVLPAPDEPAGRAPNGHAFAQ